MIHLIIIDLRITQACTLQEYDITLAYLIPRSVGIWVSTRRRRRLNGGKGEGPSDGVLMIANCSSGSFKIHNSSVIKLMVAYFDAYMQDIHFF